MRYFLLTFLFTSVAYSDTVSFDPRSCDSLLMSQEMKAQTINQDGIEIFADIKPLSETTIESLFSFLSSRVERVSHNARMSLFMIPDLKAIGELAVPVTELNTYIQNIQSAIENRLPDDGPLVIDSAELRVSSGDEENLEPFKIGFHKDGGWIASTVALKGTATFLREQKRVVLPPKKTPLVFTSLDRQALTGVPATDHGQPYGLKEERFLMVLRFLPKYKFRSLEQLAHVKKGLERNTTFKKIIPFFVYDKVTSSRHVEQYERLYDSSLNGECYQFKFTDLKLVSWSKVSPERCLKP